MPNRVKRNSSTLDMLSKVPVNKGSLLKSIDNLLKTIECSESSVMIPTLLRDKCEFDAWELLFVAKILKASILGHSDLVEFYMNHMGLSSSQFSQQAHAASGYGGSMSNGNNGNNGSQQDISLSPSPMMMRMSSPTASSPSLVAESQQQHSVTATDTSSQSTAIPTLSPTLSSTSSIAGSSVINGHNNGNSVKSQQSSASWVTANNNTNGGINGSSNNGQQQASSQVISPSSSDESGGSVSSQQKQQEAQVQAQIQVQVAPALATTPICSEVAQPVNNEPLTATLLTAVSRPMRQAQPPSLLQLTTTNNHINSVAAIGVSSFTNNSIEQLTNQLTATQQSGCLSASNGTNNGFTGFGSGDRTPLSISTNTANQQSTTAGGAATAINSTGSPSISTMNGTTQAGGGGIGMAGGRSAGCLFRLNSSGGSSPRTPLQTPTTPYPQAETLANSLLNGLSGDPSAPVRLLLQIEQLKSSINHVTNLLDSVVELYKKSIDNIAMA